jgi:hypothetical protein
VIHYPEAEILASPPYRRSDMAHDVGKRNAVHKPDEASGMELLLLSNSTLPGKAWLEHALPLIAGQVKGRRKASSQAFPGSVELLSNSSSIFSSCFKNIIEAEILAFNNIFKTGRKDGTAVTQ